jgi:hypothetical protein
MQDQATAVNLYQNRNIHYVNYVALFSAVFRVAAADVIEQIRVSPYRGLSGRR